MKKSYQYLTSFFSEKTTDPQKMGRKLIKLLRKDPENTEAALQLIKADTNVNVKDERGFTPLILAVITGHESLVTALLDKGARVNDAEENGITALMFATHTRGSAIAKILAKHGADPDIKDRSVYSADRYAVGYSDVELMNAFEEVRERKRIAQIKEAAEAGTSRKRRILRPLKKAEQI